MQCRNSDDVKLIIVPGSLAEKSFYGICESHFERVRTREVDAHAVRDGDEHVDDERGSVREREERDAHLLAELEPASSTDHYRGPRELSELENGVSEVVSSVRFLNTECSECIERVRA